MDVDTRNLTVRYLAVLAIIGLVSMVGQGLLNHRLAQQQEVSARINGAGRQRMLSQRLGHLLLRSPAEAVVLEAVLEEWVATHSALVSQPNSMGVFGSNNTDMQRRIDDLIPSFLALEQAVLARDIMSSPVESMPPGTSVEKAKEFIRHRRFHHFHPWSRVQNLHHRHPNTSYFHQY